MKIEDQVLSIEQVRELQELGFDVRKHASLYFVEEKYFVKENFIVLPEQIDITRVPEDVKITPTMTIGDIIDILPTFIEIDSSQITYKLGINNSNIQYFNNNNIFIRFENNTQIYRLFQCLKWCIKEKHIKL
jgi:hypothetical protein